MSLTCPNCKSDFKVLWYKEHLPFCKKCLRIQRPDIYIQCFPEYYIGKKVTKARKGREPKAFKSGLKINTVKGVIDHPILPWDDNNLPVKAFVFEEDDSYVECRRCREVDES